MFHQFTTSITLQINKTHAISSLNIYHLIFLRSYSPLHPEYTKNDEISSRRLAVGYVPLGGFFLGTQNKLTLHVPPGGYEQPARRFLENFQKLRILMQQLRTMNIHTFNHTIMHKLYKTWFSSPNMDPFAYNWFA